MNALLLFLACFVAPLIFFTDLTRNPFAFQQLLLCLCIITVALCSVWRSLCPLFRQDRNITDKNKTAPALRMLRTAADPALFLVIVVCLISFVFSYTGHAPFFRPAVMNAGKNGLVFLFVFCIVVFYLSASQKNRGTFGNNQLCGLRKEIIGSKKNNSALAVEQAYGIGETEESACLIHLVLITVWPLLWLLFPYFHTGAAESVAGKMFDPYGALLFAVAFFWLRPVLKKGGRDETLTLLLSTAAIASAYGIFQFCGGEIIWNIDVNPYGRRPVSTFGNPNFLSSFVVMLLPLAVYRLIYSRSRAGNILYSLEVFLYTGLLLCSMARSSWAGAAVSIFILLFFMRKELFRVRSRKTVLFFSTALLVFIFLFPEGSINYRPVVFSRVADAFSGYVHGFMEKQETALSEYGQGTSLKPENGGNKEYVFPEDDTLSRNINSSFYQRIFMWAGAWQMGRENIFFGKGFAQFELFNTFYQGRLLSAFPEFRGIRTHANAAHNIIAQAWAETGIAGLAAACILVAVFFRLAAVALRKADNEKKVENTGRSTFFIPLASGLAGMVADNMLNVSLFFPVTAALFWYIAGAFIAETGGTCRIELNTRKTARRFFAISAVLFAVLSVWTAYGQVRVFLREIYYFAGYKAFRQGRAVEASSLLDKAIKTDSGDVNTVYEYANVLATLAELKKSVEIYKLALKANSGYDEIYSNLAIVYSRLGMPYEALPYIKLATVINPFSRGSWDTMTRIYMSVPFSEINTELLMAEYAEAEKLFPADPSFANLRGYIYSRTSGKKKAAAVLASAARLHPENSIITENFLLTARESGAEKETAAWLKAYSGFASALGSAGDGKSIYETEKKLELLDRFIEKNPEDFRLQELRAKYLFKLKRYPEAAECMIYVLRHVPDDNGTRYGLAVIYETAGRYEQAVAELDMILESDPRNERALARKKGLVNLFFTGK